jgi:Ni2+-binding GTPase involved in maturation of urease and hydrogenase
MNENIIPPPPEYSPDKFVARPEVTEVLDKIRALVLEKQEEKIPKRTIAFSGERGTGKTWLLRHLAESIPVEIEHTSVYFLDIKSDTTAHRVLADFRERLLELKNGLAKTPAEASRQVLQELRAFFSTQFLVILVDQAYESDWKLLGEIEEYFLGPLAIEPRVFVVMAGRGRAYPWKTPELRLYADFRKLGPFSDVKQTAEQIDKQAPETKTRPEEIHQLSGGNPLANYYLAKGASIDTVINYILEVIPHEWQAKAREYLEALCVLQAFDEERIPAMFAAYYNDPTYLRWQYTQTRPVRDLLVKSAFARWNEDAGGFVLDSQTQHLVENYLRTEQPEKWRRLHCAAYRLYQNWIVEYTRARDHWQAQANYHAQQLREKGYDPDQCPEPELAISVATNATVSLTV